MNVTVRALRTIINKNDRKSFLDTGCLMKRFILRVLRTIMYKKEGHKAFLRTCQGVIPGVFLP